VWATGSTAEEFRPFSTGQPSFFSLQVLTSSEVQTGSYSILIEGEWDTMRLPGIKLSPHLNLVPS